MWGKVMVVVGLAAAVAAGVGGQTLEPRTAGVVPVVSRAPGAQGSQWSTSVFVSQAEGTTPATVTFTVLDPAGPGWTAVASVPAASGSLQVDDVLSFVSPAIPDGSYVLGWTATAPVVLSTRTFTVESAGSFGQGIGSVEPGTGFGLDGEVIMPAPMDAGSHRVNVGVANAGPTAHSFAIEVLDAAGAVAAAFTREVPARSIRQLRANAGLAGAGALVVRCTSGCDGHAYAYASVVANDSNDPYFLYASADAGGSEVPPVAVSRDEYGVAYITGGSLNDVFEALGYAVAEDRLWQAEVFRRQGRGTLAGLFGPGYLEIDMLLRAVGYSDAQLDQAYAALDSESRGVIQAYVVGLNRRIAEVRADDALLPFEFEVMATNLGRPVEPADWTARDVLAWAALTQRFFDPEGLQLDGPASGQLDNAALLQALAGVFPDEAAAMFADLRVTNDPAAPTMIPGEAPPRAASPLPAPPSMPAMGPVAARVRGRLEGLRRGLDALGARVKMGSYAWAVAGSRTASGHPILYSGPQMGFTAPAAVLEVSINGGGLKVSGMTIAGLPGVIVGRTRNHAWSIQAGHAHTADFYLDDPSAVVLDRVETIAVAGGDDVEVPVYRTAHGPVVEPLPYDPESPPATAVAWKYAHRDLELEIVGFMLKAARARSADEFGAAVAEAGVSQHYCYVDRAGTLAYWMSGRDPVRPAGVDVRFPLPGDGSAEWTTAAVKPRPHARDPESGFFGGWNTKSDPAAENPPNSPGMAVGPAHRGALVQERLAAAGDELGLEALRDLALDVATTDGYDGGGDAWRWVEDDFRAAVAAEPTAARTAALAVLDGWDGHLVAGGAAAWPEATTRAEAWVLQRRWVDEVLRLTFQDELRQAGLDYAQQPQIVLLNVLLHQLDGAGASVVNRYDWFRDRLDRGTPTTGQGIILAALDAVLEDLGARPWMEPRGTIDFSHDILGVLATVPFANRSTYGQCVEMGPAGPVRIETLFPLGQSGEILMNQFGQPRFSDGFFALQELFEGFEHRDFPRFE